jgi:hypothetical protein
MAWPIEMALDPVAAEDRVSELARYRANLRGCARESGHFALSADQDVLMARKSAREVKNESWVRLAGELYAEAYWLVLTVAASSIDGHMENLPTDLRHSLERLGFKSATEGQVRDLCTCADEIVGRVLDSEAAR